MFLSPSEYGKWFLQDLAVLVLPHISLILHPLMSLLLVQAQKKSRIILPENQMSQHSNGEGVPWTHNHHFFNGRRSKVCQDIFIFQGKTSKIMLFQNISVCYTISMTVILDENIFGGILQYKPNASWTLLEVRRRCFLRSTDLLCYVYCQKQIYLEY